MATSDKNKPNRFLYSARVDQAKPDTNKMLLNILKDEFPEPIVSNILIEPVLKKFFFRGKTL